MTFMCPLWGTQKIVTWKLKTYFKLKFYALSGYVGEIVEKIQNFEILSIFWRYLCFFFEIFHFEVNFDLHERFSPNFFFVCWKAWLFSREKHRLQGGDSWSRFSVILILRKKVVFFQFRRNFDLVANHERELFLNFFFSIMFVWTNICLYAKNWEGMFFLKKLESCN